MNDDTSIATLGSDPSAHLASNRWHTEAHFYGIYAHHLSIYENCIISIEDENALR